MVQVKKCRTFPHDEDSQQTDYSLLVRCFVSLQHTKHSETQTPHLCQISRPQAVVSDRRSESCKFFQQKSSFDARPATMVLLAVGACGACVVDCVQAPAPRRRLRSDCRSASSDETLRALSGQRPRAAQHERLARATKPVGDEYQAHQPEAKIPQRLDPARWARRVD